MILARKPAFNTLLFYFLPVSVFKRAPVVPPCSDYTAVTEMCVKLPRAICLKKKNMGQHNPMIFPSVNVLWLNKVLLKGMKQAASHTPLSCLISHVLILLTLVLPIFQLYDMH